jgi:predicted TIM-barrel fold metal-dependent hydrolase
MSISRRALIQRTAASLSAALAAASTTAALDLFAVEADKDNENANMPIIDTHQHLWDLKKFRVPWLADVKPLARSFVTSDYLRATAGLNVTQTVYMEVDVDPSQQTAEAKHIISLCESDDHPTSAAVISGRPASEKFDAYITPLAKNRYVKGVRQVLHTDATPEGYCLGRQFVQSIRRLGELGLRFDLCMRPTELDDGLKLARQCPDTQFVLDHCGNADPKAFHPADRRAEKPSHDAGAWRRSIDRLAKQNNVVCKISGIVVRAEKNKWEPAHLAPIVNHCRDTFGPDRVMFGGDWPVCTLVASFRQWVDALKQIIAERPKSEQKKLLHDNAKTYYGL